MAGRISGPSGRRIAAGVSDQALVSITSAGLLFMATLVLSKTHAANLLYSAQIIMFIQGAGRALIGDVLLTHGARFDDGEQRLRQFENAHATAGALAAAGMVGVVAAVWLFPGSCPTDLLWACPFIPAILLQDLARYTYQTMRDQARALNVDLIWVTVEITGLVAVIATGHAAGGPILACWGAGAGAAACVFYVRTGINPMRGRPIAWLRDTRHLLGWYTATGMLAQATTLMIGTLVQGLLTKDDYTGFRLVQMLVLQPAQSLAMALNGLLVPRSSRIAGRGDIAGLHRQTRAVLAVTVGIGMMIVLVATVAADPVLRIFKDGDYANVAVIALPISLQTLLYLAQVPLTVAIRGTQRGAHVFTQYLIFSVTSLSGLVTGAWQWGLPGAAWGLCCGAAVGLGAQGWLYLMVTRQLAECSDGPTRQDPAAPASARSLS